MVPRWRGGELVDWTAEIEAVVVGTVTGVDVKST